MSKQQQLFQVEKPSIRALWWREPFASLMLQGKVETRTWNTNYRGLVLICASIKPYDDADILKIAGGKQYGRIHTICPKESSGVAIAVGELVNCRPMMQSDEDSTFVQYRAPWQEVNKKGKLVNKRLYCHFYENVMPIETFSLPGCQGWKILDNHPEITDKIKYI